MYLQEGPSQSPKAALPGWVWEQLRSGTRCVHGRVFLEHTGAPASCAHKGFSSVHTRICVISETRRVSSEPQARLVAGASPANCHGPETLWPGLPGRTLRSLPSSAVGGESTGSPSDPCSWGVVLLGCPAEWRES